MYNVTTKLELNLFDGKTVVGDMSKMSTFVMKYKIPAVVIDHRYIETALWERTRHSGQFKIICPVDFPHGRHFALEKIRDLPQAALSADGFEIMLSANLSDKECLNELRVITEFFHKSIDPTKELRWVLGYRSRSYESVRAFLPHITKWPVAFIRTDNNLTVPTFDIKKHNADITEIKNYVGCPIKISGNVDLDTINSVPLARRFDVNMTQARTIIKQLQTKNAMSKT